MIGDYCYSCYCCYSINILMMMVVMEMVMLLIILMQSYNHQQDYSYQSFLHILSPNLTQKTNNFRATCWLGVASFPGRGALRSPDPCIGRSSMASWQLLS